MDIKLEDLSTREKIRLHLTRAYDNSLNLEDFKRIWNKHPDASFEELDWALKKFQGVEIDDYSRARRADLSHEEIVHALEAGLSIYKLTDLAKNLQFLKQPATTPRELIEFAKVCGSDRNIHELYLDLRGYYIDHERIVAAFKANKKAAEKQARRYVLSWMNIVQISVVVNWNSYDYVRLFDLFGEYPSSNLEQRIYQVHRALSDHPYTELHAMARKLFEVDA